MYTYEIFSKRKKYCWQQDFYADITKRKGFKPHIPLSCVGDCCKRAYIRGAFLASGSLADPEKHITWNLLHPT